MKRNLMTKWMMIGTLVFGGLTLGGLSSAAPATTVAVYSDTDNNVLSYSNASTESDWQALTFAPTAIGISESGTVSSQLKVSASIPAGTPSGLSVAMNGATSSDGMVWVYLDIERTNTAEPVNMDVPVTVTNTATGQSITQTIHVIGAAVG